MMQTQIEVKEIVLFFLERKHLLWDYNLALNVIPCFCGHTEQAPLQYIVVITVRILDDISLQTKFHTYENWRKI